MPERYVAPADSKYRALFLQPNRACRRCPGARLWSRAEKSMPIGVGRNMRQRVFGFHRSAPACRSIAASSISQSNALVSIGI